MRILIGSLFIFSLVSCKGIRTTKDILLLQLSELEEVNALYIKNCSDSLCVPHFYSIQIEKNKYFKKMIKKYKTEYSSFKFSLTSYDSAKSKYDRVIRAETPGRRLFLENTLKSKYYASKRDSLIAVVKKLGKDVPTMQFMERLLSLNLEIIEIDSDLRKAQIEKFSAEQALIGQATIKKMERISMEQKREALMRDINTLKLRLRKAPF